MDKGMETWICTKCEKWFNAIGTNHKRPKCPNCNPAEPSDDAKARALQLCDQVIDDAKSNGGACMARQNTIEAIKAALQSAAPSDSKTIHVEKTCIGKPQNLCISDSEAVAWQCKDYADGWITFNNQKEAESYSGATGCGIRCLYTTPPSPACVDVEANEMINRLIDFWKGDGVSKDEGYKISDWIKIFRTKSTMETGG